MEDGLSAIDWRTPWYAPWRDAQSLPTAMRFVPHDALPPGEPYERFIFETGQVPVRPGLHDFFNSLVWRAFPRTKSAMNRLQAEAIARDGIGARRGPVRDAITIFDENGALLEAPDAIWDALLAREWGRLFIDLRPLWKEARLLIFGHALLEQLFQPRKGLTAHVLTERRSAFPGETDEWLCRLITQETLAAKPFTPLPVLGVPGWWAQNEQYCFYDDPLVFRPRRA